MDNDPSAPPPSDDEITRRLGSAGLLPEQNPAPSAGASLTPSAPATPSVPAAPSAPTVTPVPGMGASASFGSAPTPKAPSYAAPAPFDPSATNTAPASSLADPSAGMGQPPALPKVPSYAPPASFDGTGGSGFGGVPQQPTAPKSQLAGIPGFENFDDSAALAGLPQSPEHYARASQMLAGGGTDSGSTSAGASVPPGQGTAPTPNLSVAPAGQPATPKAYTIGADGVLSLDPTNLVNGLLDANRDGLVDNDKLKGMLPSALQAEQAAQDQASLQQRVSADDWAKGKAYAHGAAGGLAMVAGAGPGAIVGGNIGTAAGAALGAVATPFVGPEFIPALATGGRIVGSVIGGLAGAKASGAVAQQVGDQLAQHSATIRSFSDAAQVYPNYDKAGELTSFLLPAGGAISNLAKVGALAGGGSAGAQAIANRVLLGATGGAAFEGIARPAFDATVNAGANALGIQTNPVQMPTLGSIAQNAALGALLAGHAIEFNKIGADDMASILNRGEARIAANVGYNETIPPDKLAKIASVSPNMTQDALADIQRPLSNAEREVFFRARDEANKLAQQGITPTATAVQATQGGQPIGAAAVDVRAKASSPPASTGQTPTSLPQLPPGYTPATQDSASSSAPAPVAPPPVGAPGQQPPASAPRVSPGASSASPSSTAPLLAGQASPASPSQDDQRPPSAPATPASSPSTQPASLGQASSDALSALTKLRDGQAAMIQGGKFSDAELPTAQAMLAHLNAQVAQAQPPAADSAPSAPASAPVAPAPVSDGVPPATDLSSSGSPAAADTPPSPRVGDSLPAGASTSPSNGNPPSGADRMPATGQPPAPAPTAYHQRLADAVNSGALSDRDDGRPSTTFHVLSRLRNFGAEVTPETARDVSTGVSSILDDSSTDREAKQAALKQLFRSNLPSEQHQDGGSSAPATSTSPPAPGSGAAPATPAAGATPEPDEPQPIAAPRQTEDRVVPTPAGPKLIPADTDDVAAARTWLAEQRDAGRNPASAEVARQTGVDFNTASRLRADQSAAEMRAAIPETPEVPHVKMGDQVQLDPKFPARTVTQLFDDGSVGVSNANGQQIKIPGKTALARKVAPQTPAAPTVPSGSSVAPAGDGTSAPATTYSSVVGKKLDSRRTAFAPESGTLGIPRVDMPQVAAEHRGAFANFLEPRGVGWQNDEVLPGSLKPSQADFNPAKVEKARGWVGDSDRRILTSSDNHVIDGHHQWLARLKDHPNESMPVVRLNAPARDILSQVHEFPSAGMDKAPDLAPRIASPPQQGDSPNTIKAREWLADQRQAGNNPSVMDMVRDMKVRPDVAQRILADQEAAEQAPLQKSGEDSQTSTERQPITGNGKVAAGAIKKLAAKKAEQNGFLSPSDEKTLANWREVLDKDLNRQALGPNPQPTTEAGKAARRTILALETARDAGAALSPSEHAAWKNALATLQSDFTAQRLALDAKQAQAPAPTEPAAPKPPVLSQNKPASPTDSSPTPASAPSAPAPAFKPRQEVVYKGRTAVIESIKGDRAVVRVRAGQDPTTGANLVAKKVTGVPVSSLQAKPIAPAVDTAPITIAKAAATAKAQLTVNRALLRDLGVQQWKIGPTDGASGVEVGDDGVLRISPEKLASSMTSVRDRQAKDGIAGSPEEWFLHVLSEEGVHAADIAVAKSKGQTIVERYNGLPDAAMPAGWQKAGRQAYGPKSWDALPGWAQKAEFTRMAVQGKWTGRITEQFFKFIKEAIDYLKGLAGFKDLDPRFQAHVEEVEQRLGRAVNAHGTASNAPRSFKMPTAAGGYHDVFDHIAAEGGMVSQARARGRDTFTKYAGDYDGAPTLGGFYHHAVYRSESSTMPDQMAETLHQNYGVGDGSVDGMWKAIQQAVDSRRAASARQKTLGDAQKQTDRFDRDAVEQATAKGAHAINVAELNVGDHVTIGDQTLKVIGVDPDNLDVTLEDHAKYGVQRVADGTALYVEKVQPGGGDNSLAAARPDRQTLDLFPEDEPFDLRGEALPDAERVAAARELARRQPPAVTEQPASPSAAVPRISAGERGTGDLFQGDDAPFNLQGEEGTDGERVQRALEQSAQDAAEAKAIQARDQGNLFAAPPEEGNVPTPGRPPMPDPTKVPSIKALVDETTSANAPQRRRFVEYGTVGPEQAAQLKADTGLDLAGYRRNLDNMAVRHVLKNHGDPAAEIARGNAPLNREDFERLPQILDHPDASIYAGKNRVGQDMILSAKRVNGYYVVAEEVRDGRRSLNLTTLYKKSAPPLARESAQGAASLQTPETLQSAARQILQQVVGQHNFLRGQDGGDSLAAAAPEPVDVAGAKNPDDPTNLRSTRAAWKAAGVKSPMFKRYFGDWQKDPVNASKVVDATGKPLVVYHGSPALANGGGFDAFHVPASAGDLLAGSGVYLTDSKPIAQSYTLNRDELLSGGNVDTRNVPASTQVMPLYASIRKPFQAGDAGLADARAIVAAELAKQPADPPLRRRDGTVIQPPSAAERAAQAVDNAARLYPPGDPLRSYEVLRDALSDEGVIQSARVSAGDQLRDVLRAHGFDGIAHEGGVQGDQKHQVFVAFDPTQVKSAEPAGSPRSNSGAFDPNNPSMLAAAAPEAEDPLFEKPVAPASSTLKRGSQAWAKAKLAEQRAKSEMVDSVSAHKDAAGTMADIAGRQANESVQLDLPDARDRQAAGPVVEAGGDRARLAADLAKVQASPNPKLAAKYAPIYQHALNNLPRLNAAADGYRQIDAREDAAAEQAGLPPQWQPRMKHVYEDPTSPQSTVPLNYGFGTTKGFKTAADAIAAGVDPKSADLGDLAQRRVQRNQSAINEHAFQSGLASLKASDGKPIISGIQESGTKLNAAGDPFGTAKVPAGYEAVQAGPNVLTVHQEFAPLLRALYGESAVANNFLGKHLLDLAAITKHGAIGIDTYHGFQVVIRSLLGHGVADYKEGLAGLRFADADLDRAVKAGKISQADADATRAARRIDEGLLREGLNVGKAGDNLLEAARQHNLVAHIPVLGKAATWVNELTFHQIQPGFMRQAARAVFARNQTRFPELGEQELFRRTAREVNEFYGNLGSQGFLKSKTMQDLAKLTLFAPGFTEGRFRTEARGIGQAARVPVDGFSGRGWRLGTMAQAMGGIVLASLIGNQVVNLLTRGKPTWENEEDGHQLDAWLPGGPHGKGFFFSPLSIAAEYSHSLIKYMEHRESAVDALAHIAGNKLSGGARAVKTLVTGQDYKGQPFASMGERLKAAATEVLPLPMQLSPWISKNPQGVLGLGVSHEKGSLEKQLLASAGLRVDPADSARSQMYNLAQAFRGPQADQQQHGPSAYAALRTALGNEDADGARAEVQRLVTEGHKTLGQIADKAAGIKDGKVHPELFTGSREKDLQMLASLTPAQKQVYRQAFQDRVADARLLAHLIATMPADQKRALQIASAMNGRGNKIGAAQVGKSSVLQPTSPAPSVPAQPAAPALRPRTGIADAFRS